MEAVLTEVKEIKSLTMELVRQGAVHNHVLVEHHKRSTMLEERVKPLESDLQFRQRLYVLVMGSSGLLAVAAFVVAILKG